MDRLLHPIANRLFRLVFGWYLVLAVLVTGAQLTYEYYTVVDEIDEGLESLGEAFTISAAEALWTFDTPLLESMVQGIAKSPVITGVLVLRANGAKVAGTGIIPAGEADGDKGAFAPYREKVIALTIANPRGETMNVGSLRLYSDRGVALDKVKDSFVVIFFNSLIKTAGLWLIFHLVISKTVAASLAQATEAISNLRFFDDPKASADDLADDIAYGHRDEIGGLIDATRDLRKRLSEARNEVSELQRSLELKVDERTNELKRSNAELEQFAYVVSHDLREPLRMVSSFVSLLERKYSAALNNEAHEYIAFARDGALRMDHLICDLLDYSRIGRTSKTFESVRLDELVKEVLLNLFSAIESSGGKVNVSPGLPVVRGNPGELSRLFQNLIGNALKYRDPLRPPVVDVDARREDEMWRISIKDNGIGIASDDFERVFRIFQRLHSRDAYEGTGIGLAICKKIVEQHDGRIWIESIPGQGTTFHFTLPA